LTNPAGCDTVPGTESPHTPATENDNVAHEYCIALYDALKKRAVKNEFTGSITEVYKTLGISNQYYSKITQMLVETGSVEHVQRGHHKRPSIYRLLHKPTKAQLEAYDTLMRGNRKRGRVSEKEILTRIEKLERSVRNVDIIAALQNLEGRIQALEKQGGNT
jgi:hypothetical protein